MPQQYPTNQANDPHDLARFVEAQAATYDQALAEIRQGRKRSHWMWFIFPQLDGLGRSSMAQRYAIKELDEARAYLAHELLGPRLAEIFAATLGIEGRSAKDIFGTPDDLKLRSCASLFDYVSSADSVYARVLEKYFGGRRDRATLELLENCRQSR